MNRYHINKDGKTVDQYGREFAPESMLPNERRGVANWRKPRTVAVKLVGTDTSKPKVTAVPVNKLKRCDK